MYNVVVCLLTLIFLLLSGLSYTALARVQFESPNPSKILFYSQHFYIRAIRFWFGYSSKFPAYKIEIFFLNKYNIEILNRKKLDRTDLNDDLLYYGLIYKKPNADLAPRSWWNICFSPFFFFFWTLSAFSKALL